MKYPFDTVRQVYLRRFLAELNDIAINTPQDDYESFLKLFKKSKDYIKTNALLKTIEILDNTYLTKKDVQTLLTTLNLRTSRQDKETKIVIANLNAVLQCELPKLFKSFHTDARKKYLRNTFRKVKASLSELLSNDIRTLYDISISEYEDALIKINFERILWAFEKRVVPIREKISLNKDYHFPLFDTENCTYVALDEVINDTTNGNYLKYFHTALFQSAKYILLSKILVQKNQIVSAIDTNSHKQKLARNLNIAYDVSTMLTLKNLGKNRTSVYMVNLAYYLQLTPFEAFDFSNYYLGKGNSTTIKKKTDLKNINNSFHAIHMSLFPNYILYKNFKANYQPDDDFFLKKASNILFTMILEDFNRGDRPLNQEEMHRKDKGNYIITYAIRQKIMHELQSTKPTFSEDNGFLTQLVTNSCTEIYKDVQNVFEDFSSEDYIFLNLRLKLNMNNIYKFTLQSLTEELNPHFYKK